jgi:NitT/TauT family transport system permease protein
MSSAENTVKESAAKDAGREEAASLIAGHRVAERRASQRAFASDLAIRLAFVVFLGVLWQGMHYLLVTRTGNVSRGALFPSPLQVLQWVWDGFGLSYLTGNFQPPPRTPMPQNFWQAFSHSDYPAAIFASIWRLMEGYIISVVVGFPLGLLVARSSLVDKTLGWLSIALQALPSMCWIPLAVLWFGRLHEAPILFVTIMGSLFATIIAVADGIRNVPPIMARAGRTLGADGPRLYFSILLPAALPTIVIGLKIGWSFAWRSLMAAELIVPNGGLGFLLQRDREFGDAEGVLATIIVIIIIGLGVQAIVFTPIEKRLQGLWGLTGVRS